MPVRSRKELADFEDSHEASCGPDVAMELSGTLDDLPNA